MTETEVLSSEDLRNRLFDTLKKRGLVDNLKTQLRNRLVAELKQMGVEGEMVGGRGRVVASLSDRAVNSLIANHLTSMNYEYSLSVFLPEANLQPNEMISTEDILHLLQISTQSPVYKRLMDGKKGKCKDVLWMLLGEVASRRLTVDCSVQTESSRVYEGSLEEELRQIDRQYSSSHAMLKGGAAVEERILSYQRLLEERSAEELQHRMARFRQNELNQLKLLENEKTRKAIEKARREMEASYQVKYEALAERERSTTDQLRRLQEGADKDAHAQRQLLLEEIEAVRQREVLMRKQEETNNRERMMWEEKVRGREEAARRVEESGRRLEAEYQQRINSEINRFKLEEQAKYLDRLRSLEYREEKVKSSESRINEEVKTMTNTNKELRERRAQVLQLEEELIKIKQELLSAQKHLELNAENTREVANAQTLKESNAVLKKELDMARQQMAALTRDLLIEREKREDMLKEYGHMNAMPTSEKYMLQKKVELLEGTLRTERALVEHARGQTEHRHELQMTENRERLADYDVYWTNDIMLSDEAEVSDVRRRRSLKARARNPYSLDSATAAAAVDASLYVEGVDPRLLVESPRAAAGDNGSVCDSTGEFSYSSDLVRDTKKRIQRLETEAERLEKNYQEFQFRVTSLEPVLPLNPANIGRSCNEVSVNPISHGASRSGISPRHTNLKQPISHVNVSSNAIAVRNKGASVSDQRVDNQRLRRDERERSELSTERRFTSKSPPPRGGSPSHQWSETSPERLSESPRRGSPGQGRKTFGRVSGRTSEELRVVSAAPSGSSPESVERDANSTTNQRQLQQRSAHGAAVSPVSSTGPEDRSILYDDESFSAKNSPKRDGRRSLHDNDSSHSETVSHSSSDRPVAAVMAPSTVSDSKPAAAASTVDRPTADRPRADSKPAASAGDTAGSYIIAADNVDDKSKMDPVMEKYFEMVKKQKEAEKQQQKQRSPSPSEITESIPDQNSDDFDGNIEIEGDDRSW